MMQALIATIILTMELVPMESNQTRTNVPTLTEGGIGVVSRNGTRSYPQVVNPLTQPGLPVCPLPEVPSVTNAIALHRFSTPLNIQFVRQWCCELTPKLFSFVDRVRDLHRVTLKALYIGFESSVAKPANSLPHPTTYYVR